MIFLLQMHEDAVWLQIDQFPLREYVHQARVRGVLLIDDSLKAAAARLHLDLLNAPEKLSFELQETVELAKRFSFAPWFFAQNEKPRYQAYSNIRILNWVLGVHRRSGLSSAVLRARTVLLTLVDDLLLFEKDSLLGINKRSAEEL